MTDSSNATTLELPPPQRAELERLVRAGYPDETCGLLLGQVEAGVVRVREVLAARNLVQERSRDRYELDPTDQLRAHEHARELGLEVVGIWHSHPDHPARPSETDRAAAWEGWSYLIASVGAGALLDLRSWRLHDGAFEEEPLTP